MLILHEKENPAQRRPCRLTAVDMENINIMLNNMVLRFSSYSFCRDSAASRCSDHLFARRLFPRVLYVLYLLYPVLISLRSLSTFACFAFLTFVLERLTCLLLLPFLSKTVAADAGAGRDWDWEEFHLSRMLRGDWPKDFSLWDCMETEPCTFLEGGM